MKRMITLLLTLALFSTCLAVSTSAAPAITKADAIVAFEGTASPYGCPVDLMFDGNTNSKWCHPETDSYVIVETAYPISLLGYVLATADDNALNPGRNPENWTLYGSNDKEKWVALDQHTGDKTMQDVNHTPYYFALGEASATYRYFKLHITKIQNDACLQISEFKLITEPYAQELLRPAVNASTVADATWGAVAQMFDGNPSTKWCGQYNGSASIVFSTLLPITVGGYRMMTADDTGINPGRNPESWVLYGSNNLTNWTAIDTKDGDKTMEGVNFTTYTFSVASQTTAYRYFKLDISKIRNGGCIQIAEFSLIPVLSNVGEANVRSDKAEYTKETLKVMTNQAAEDAGWLVVNSGSALDNIRYTDCGAELIYRFDLTQVYEPTITLNILAGYKIEIAATANGPWNTVADSAENGTNNIELLIDPATYGVYDYCYIRISDTTVTDGGGAQIQYFILDWYEYAGEKESSPDTSDAMTLAISLVGISSVIACATAEKKRKD